MQTPLWETVKSYSKSGYAPTEAYSDLLDNGELQAIVTGATEHTRALNLQLSQTQHSEATVDPQALSVAEGIEEPAVEADALTPRIASKSFSIMPSGITVICEIVMVNGFIMRGESYVRGEKTEAEYDVAMRKAYNDAIKKVKPFEAYLLREKEYEARKSIALKRIGPQQAIGVSDKRVAEILDRDPPPSPEVEEQ